MDDRNRRGCVSDGQGGWRCDNNDRVDFQANHLRSKILKSLGTALRVAAFDNEVLPLRVPEFAKTLEQEIIKFLIPVRDKPNAPDFARLLRARNKRPSCCPSEHGKECAPFHVPSRNGKRLQITS
jgi:hypothetical protein